MKPSMDEVLAYATKSVNSQIKKLAPRLPEEQKEEISQNALMRVFKIYEDLDPNQTWEAFVSLHCRGAVLDYTKQGHGFIHQKSQRYKRESFLSQVTAYSDEDGKEVSIEQIVGASGIFHESETNGEERIKWDLVARMASVDHTIHLVGKILLGFSIAELEEVFGVSRERLSQRYHSFLAELSSPSEARDPWLNQALFAFAVGDEAVDNGLGYDYQPIDLYSLKPVEKDKGLHKSAIAWVKELYPDLLAIKKANINWDLVSKLARHDEQLHMVACILLGVSPADICEYFDIGMNAARNKVQRFVARLDASDFYGDPWTNQVINALGLYKTFGQQPSHTDFGVGLEPINLTDFSVPRYRYDRGDQLSLLMIIPGHKLQDGTEMKKTRSLRKVPMNRDDIEDKQTDFLNSLISDTSGTSLIA